MTTIAVSGTPVDSGSAGSGGLNLSYGAAGNYNGWDRFGRIVRQEWKSGGGTVKDGYVYTYDRNSNRTTKDVTSASAPSNLDEAYGYDGLDRLTSFDRGTLSGGTISSPTFYQDWTTLDSLGNWQSFDNNGTSQTRTSNAANETTAITQGTGDWIDPAYDAAGNMTSGPKAGAETTRLHYVYDAWNRLVQANNDSGGSPGSVLATYRYDGRNYRVSKNTGGNTDDFYYNDGWQTLEVRRNSDADPLEQYVWDQRYIDAPVVRFRDTNLDGTVDETLYYTNDANMNVTALVDTGGTAQERYVDDAYGKVAFYNGSWTSIGSSAKSNSVLDDGYWKDAETGLDYVRNRYKNSSTGNWNSRDPIEEGMNLNEYVGSKPISSIDPMGLADQWLDTLPDDPYNLKGRSFPKQPISVRERWDRAMFGSSNINPKDTQHLQHTATAMLFALRNEKQAKALERQLWADVRDFVGFGNRDATVQLMRGEGLGTYAGFKLLGATGFFNSIPNDNPFWVRLYRDDFAHKMYAETLGRHPLQGIRRWEVVTSCMDNVWLVNVVTESYDKPSGWQNELGKALGGDAPQLRVWEDWFTTLTLIVRYRKSPGVFDTFGPNSWTEGAIKNPWIGDISQLRAAEIAQDVISRIVSPWIRL